MWTSQVYGHHDKMARTKTHITSQTRSLQRRNIHKEIIFFCVFRIFVFFIFNMSETRALKAIYLFWSAFKSETNICLVHRHSLCILIGPNEV